MLSKTYIPSIDVDALPCGIVSVDENGKINFVNNYICHLLGYSNEELLEKKVELLFTISAKIFYQTHFYPLVKLHNKAEEVFFSLMGKDGSHVPVIGYATKTDEYICCVFVPVRERRKYEQEILQSKKTAEAAIEKNEALTQVKNELEFQLAESDRQLTMLRQFNEEYIELNRIISHDLHEPVRKLMVHIDRLFVEENITKEKIESSLQKMMEFCTRLRQLTISLQQYVSVDVLQEAMVNIDLQQVIKKCFDIVATEDGYTGAELRIENLQEVEGYPSQIERLFCEIIGNSFKFRNEDVPLKINIRSTIFSDNIYKEIKDKYKYIDFVRIEITDNGPGFPAEYNEYIFGLFKRVRLDKNGLGFGLALCKRIVERHKGSITSKSVNGTTSFNIVLPLKQTTL